MEKPNDARGNVETAKECLRLIRDIAALGASARDAAGVGFALQELSQVLYERAGDDNRVFEPVLAEEIQDLDHLLEELRFVHGLSEDLCRVTSENMSQPQ